MLYQYSLNRLHWLLVISLIFTACSGNAIYFDKEQQAVITCNGNVIRSLYISDEAGEAYYHFEKIGGREGVRSFSLGSISNDYHLEGLFQEKVELKKFRLDPGRTYTIRNISNGDAASSDIQVTIGENGSVKTASKLNCEE